MSVIYHMRDINLSLVAAWQRYFGGIDTVRVTHGDIFAVEADAIVSPANSFGFMDGGIDLIYSLRFGWQLQDRLRQRLQEEYDGELPVGMAVLMETQDAQIPYMVSAPTMRVPTDVSDTLNAYLAFRATLRLVERFNESHPDAIRTLLCPGLGTATGNMSPEICARQMHAAYMQIIGGQAWQPRSVNDILLEHYRLLQR